MRIAFVDSTGWDFNVETPFRRPLGGAQSAACYLAIALAQRGGNDVSLISNTSEPGDIRGVHCLATSTFAPAHLPELKLDAAILLLGAGTGYKLREALGSGPRSILWTGHDIDQKGVAPLAEPGRRDVFDGFAFVSEWQRQRYVEKFALPAERCTVLRNAIAPAFENLFAPGESIPAAKARPPILAYTSTPYRGLDVLLALFPQIRQRVPGTRLNVYSDMSMYMRSEQEDQGEYGELYRLAREIDGVEMVGAVPQPVLAQRLREAAVLAYPNTFAETSCIAVMEAMAGGCRIVTSELAALPGTTAGFAALIPIDRGPEEYARRFVDAAVTALEQLDSPDSVELLARQVRFVADSYTWSARAEQWEKWLAELPAGHHTLAQISAEQSFPVANLPKNTEPMDPYFGRFFALLRQALANGGSEFGLGLSLFSLAASIRAATVIEIGRFKGFSTLALASALRLIDAGWEEPPVARQRPDVDYTHFEGRRRRQVISIDPFPTREAADLLEQAGLTSYVTMLDQRSDSVTLDATADLIFIDGEHTVEGCMGDVRRFVEKNLRPGGYFVLHDYYGWYDAQKKSVSPVRAVIEQLIARGELEHLLIDTGYMSFVIFRKPDPKSAATLAKL